MFASIPNFTNFNSNVKGEECIQLLNKIIVNFDQILCKKKFKLIEKIKTIGSTYMAASGLNLDTEQDEFGHLCDLVEFALEVKQKLLKFNEKTDNDFKLRTGNNQ